MGVRLAPDGNMLSQIEHMISQTTEFATKLKRSNLSGYDALLAINTRIMRTLIYPLPTLTLTQEDCTRIMKPLLHSVLGKAKIVRTIKRAVLYGPQLRQGFGLTNLYVYQGCAQIVQLIQFFGTNTELGKVHNITLQHLMMELGVPGIPFQQDYKVLYHCATDSLIKHVWKFCHEHKITLNKSMKHFTPQRQGDQCLMTIFIAHGYKGSQLASINRCRLYCKVIWLSDILTADGLYIHKTCFNSNFDSSYDNDYIRPTQWLPGKADWVIWGKAVRNCFAPQRSTLLLPQ